MRVPDSVFVDLFNSADSLAEVARVLRRTIDSVKCRAWRLRKRYEVKRFKEWRRTK